MAQRTSEYERKERDLYETPDWVTQAILPFIPKGAVIWEPACASGKMARVLNAAHASDIVTDYGETIDFLESFLPRPEINAIITNPPFGRTAHAFIRHALKLMKPCGGFVAMLAPMTFDAASQRFDIFGDCSAYMGKLTLTKRIVWFEDDEDPDKVIAPSSNHAWFMWDFQDLPIHYPVTSARTWYYYDKS